MTSAGTGAFQQAAAPRLWQLDVLRALAVMLVFARHLPIAQEYPDPGWSSGEGWPPPVCWLIRGGWVGVDLFFVLSGYLIGGLLLAEVGRTGKLDVKRFLVRRAWRLYPPFYAFLAFALITQWAHEGLPPHLRQVAVVGLFLQTYVPAQPLFAELNAHLWSLCVEEHFYLGLPLLISLLLWLGCRGNCAAGMHLLPWLALLVAVLAIVLRLEAAERGGVWQAMLPTHLRMDSLMAGVILAYARQRNIWRFDVNCRRWRWPLLTIGVVGLIPAFTWDLVTTPFIHTYGFTLLALACVALVAGSLGLRLPPEADGRTSALAPLKRALADRIRVLTRGIAGFGRVSYSTYLWHWPIALALSAHLSGAVPSPLRSLIFIGLSAAAGAIAARLVEGPTLRLRDRLTPSQTPAIPAPANS